MSDRPGKKWLKNPKLVMQFTRNLIELWDSDSDRTWTVSGDRHGVNVAMINAFTAHSVNLTRAVVNLYEAGHEFASVSLVRSTMECAVTATWLALSPEKTMDFLKFSAKNRRTMLMEIIEQGMGGETALAQNEETLERLRDNNDPEGKILKNRFEALESGPELYLMYRALSAYAHPTNWLADNYTETVERSESNQWGVVMLNEPNDDSGSSWLGIQAALLLRAQIAADSILVKPRHATQLRRMADQLGVQFQSRLAKT